MKRSPALAATCCLGLLAMLVLWTERQPETAPWGRAGSDGRRPVVAGPAGVRDAKGIPHSADRRVVRSGSFSPDALDRAVAGERFHLTLPDGREAAGGILLIRRDAEGVLAVQGWLDAPRAGRYFFQRQTVDGVAGELVGHILFEGSPMGWKVEPMGPGGAPLLVERHQDAILCANYILPPTAAAEEAPQTHPVNIPIPSYQSIIPLQSLPGATGVIYLDFDGEEGPFTNWGDFDAAPSPASNAQIFDVWKRVVEDFQGFNLNITTDRKVFDAAPEGRRQHVVISPTNTAAPSAGGVAYVGSYNWSGDTVCWAFYSTGKTSAEVISHEVGHALSLSHDGRTSPAEGYYAGHGSGVTGWAPIMGVGYYESLTQWSKGQYPNANNPEDDLAVIVSNNDVDYRDDDGGDTLVTARFLEIAANDSVSGEGIIERTGDVDAFRFATSGGQATLNLNPVSSSPNLDICAELVDASTGTIVATSNPDLGVAASISETLPAGEYLLAVRGTGRGEPMGDGYTDYGSLGTYFISGSVAGGVKPERFTITENSALGTPVGTVPPRVDHGASPLLWSITGGTGGGIILINPSTGELSVAAALDFESLSTRWDDPAEFELSVTITNTLEPSLTETLRVVVAVSDANEAPVVTDGSLTLLERTRPGTNLMAVAAEDPDRFQFPVFSIVGGNDNGWFAIDAGSGELRVAGEMEVTEDMTVPITVQVSDQGTPALSSTATVNLTVIDIAGGYVPGGVMRNYFEGISGSSISNLIANPKFPDHPDSEEFLSDFDGRSHGENFGSTLRGYVIPPVTGSYRFWIAADEAGQLRLSNSSSPWSASTIASISGGTDPYSWPDSGSQQSSLVTLTAGQPYYIEARHKESGGEDHLAVAWSGPGIPKQLLRGPYLAPYEQNYAPKVIAASVAVNEDAFAGQAIGTVTVTDVNGEDSHGNFAITAGNDAGIFAIDPVSGVLRVVAAHGLDASEPVHPLTISVTDNGSPAETGTGSLTVTVLPAGAFATTNLFQQVWTGIAGNSVTYLTGNANYPYRPSFVRTLSGFESAVNIADSYGSRIRAWVTAPATGNYTFYLSSDEDSRLLFGSSPSAAVQIASVTGHANKDEWTRFPSQSSSPVQLVGGETYYLETLHKEGTGNDHVQVAWTGPGIPFVTVIPAWALQPYDLNEAPVVSDAASLSVMEGSSPGTVVGTVAAIDPEGETPIYAIAGSSTPGAFAVDATTGVITVADLSTVGPGLKAVTVSAQDHGIGGNYPLKTGSRDFSIAVISNNQAPAFTASSLIVAGTEDESFAGSLTATDPDPGDVLTFSKVSGPEWLVVLPDGTLAGRPGNDDVGGNEFIVGVSDPEGLSHQATLFISVENANDPPVFAPAPRTADPATEDMAYQATVAEAASDPDANDTLDFSKVSGPDWLTVAADGSLAGTPANGDVGDNLFVVRVTDAAGQSAEASFSIEVANLNDAPVFALDPLVWPAGFEEEAYLAPGLSGSAIDPDVGATPVYSITAGPSWLVLSPEGELSGTPPQGSAGTNTFTIRATDPGGLYDEATLVIEIPSSSLPLPWEEQKIGDGLGGQSSAGVGTLTIAGSGVLTGRNDNLHFVWQPLSGDGAITARLDAMLDTGADARAGVMIRDTLAMNSRHVFLGMTSDGGYRWVRRTSTHGNTSTSSSGAGIRPDAWLRLVRTGNTITAFKSPDGVEWITVGSLTAALPPTCYFGLAVASGSLDVENTAIFSHVALTP